MAGRRDGDYIQRPRFIGISEFGPNAVIYHEGARYQVYRAQIAPAGVTGEGVPTSSARRCGHCGHLHGDDVGTDRCESCDEPLTDTTHNLLRLSAVHTRRRERISSDEEERRRSGFEIEVSYRFSDPAGRRGRIHAAAVTDQGSVLELAYGDAATVRVTNLGLRRRKASTPPGYPIDINTGDWLDESGRASRKEASSVDSSVDILPDADAVTRKQRVIPYVEDRRNIAVLRQPHRVDESTAITTVTALERGIEAAFQLEDSELESRMLPDTGERGRALLIESAEGGAGVLRRLVEDPTALPLAARTALALMHFDPDTGADLSAAPTTGEHEPCVRACYECLLSYGNQFWHTAINRHQVKGLLLALAGATTRRTGAGQEPSPPPDGENAGPAGRFFAWLRRNDYRLPDSYDAELFGGIRPDAAYSTGYVAVFVGNLHAPGRDHNATEDLLDGGWTAIRIADDESEWERIVARYPSIFGHR